MPVFMIHASGKDPRKALFDLPEIQVGRSPDVELVLPSSTVSRRHAVFSQDRDAKWTVRCVSGTNPIVVDGKLVREFAAIEDGSEILIGAEFLLVFVRRDADAFKFGGGRSVYAPTRCTHCNWSGMLSAFRAKPVCPACGSPDILREDQYDASAARKDAVTGSTKNLDARAVREHFHSLKTAQMSVLVRLDDEGGRRRKELSEEQPVRLSKKDGADFKLFGMVIGSGLEVTWNGSRYEVHASLEFPSMKVNGKKTRKARLKPGDMIEVGKNRFRYEVE